MNWKWGRCKVVKSASGTISPPQRFENVLNVIFTIVPTLTMDLSFYDLFMYLCISSVCVCVYFLQCLPLWPESSTDKLCIRVVGSELTSKSFFFNKQDNGTLLCMEQVSIFVYWAGFNRLSFTLNTESFIQS